MSLAFTRAVAVAEGEKVTSTQLKILARAFNDRFRAFSFCPWRLVWFWHNLFRQVRNPAEPGFVFPPQGEFFHIYQFLDPEYHGGTTWPVAGPGEFEGANLASVMMQYVFGVAPDLDSDDVRINDVFASFLPTSTLEDIWQRGKEQRGVYDPISTAQNTPALDVAQNHFRIVQPWWSPHGKALGGWLPTPVELAANCGAAADTGQGIPSYELKWTSLAADVDTTGLHGTITTNANGTKTVTYAGTCGCGMDNVAVNHVIGVAAWPFAWYVAVVTNAATCAYAIDIFPVADWIEGPYEGQGVLAHTEGKQLQRSLWWFHEDFRGTPDQRSPDTYRIRGVAFDNQDFFTRQYPLAPNKGRLDGDSILALYPRADWTIPGNLAVPHGTYGDFAGEASHVYEEDFVLGGVFARASKLTARVQLEVLSSEQLLTTLDLNPDQNGDAFAITWLKNAIRPDPLKVRVSGDAVFLPGGALYFEATEQVAYKPQFWDAALVSRVSASVGGDKFGAGVDGRGLDNADAPAISRNFFAYGALVNTSGVRDQGEWVNDHPVFDAARRLSRDHCRITRRQQLVSYEVAGGKSIFRFKRFVQYPGIDGVEVRADCFKDIAPPLDPVTDLLEGETYIVRGTGSVTYRGATFRQNDTFTATSDLQFQLHDGAALYVYDGIKHAALKKGFTNEWTMFVEPRCYHPSGSSIWKPDAYSDYFTFCDRCHFYSGTAPTSLRRFSTYNHTTDLDGDFNPVLNPISLQAQLYSPEVPDQFRYSAGANRTYNSADFFSSCQVLNPPYEIESCIVEDWSADQIIKVTLAGRLRSHSNAPASVAVDSTTWSAGDVEKLRNAGATPENYRTDDNAVREYVLSEASGSYHCVFRTGDAGTNSGVSGLPDNPFGSCYPVFFFARLIPEPYDDGNDVHQAQDSRCVIDSMLHMEIALRSMCEGFVDGRTSERIICDTGLGNLYDYTFENLCFEAFTGKDIGAFELAARSDRPAGFGPLPNTLMYAEVFNRLVATVNLLDKVRLDLPVQFSFRALNYTGTRAVTPIFCSATSSCSTSSFSFAYLDNVPPPSMGAPTVGGWSTGTSFGSTAGFILDGCPFVVSGSRGDTEYRVEINPSYANALPAAVQELLDLSQSGFLASISYAQRNSRREVTNIVGDGDGCGPPGDSDKWFDTANPGDKFKWLVNANLAWTECKLVSSGVLSAPSLLAADVGFGCAPPFVCHPGGASSDATMSLIAQQEAYIQVPVE